MVLSLYIHEDQESINNLIKKEIGGSGNEKKVLLKHKTSNEISNKGSRNKVVRSEENIDSKDKKKEVSENKKVENVAKGKNKSRKKDNEPKPEIKKDSIEDSKKSKETHVETGKDYQLHEEKMVLS